MNANFVILASSLPSISIDNVVLIDVLKYVRGVHEDADGAGGGDGEEDVELEAVDHHGHVLPVLADLQHNAASEHERNKEDREGEEGGKGERGDEDGLGEGEKGKALTHPRSTRRRGCEVSMSISSVVRLVIV